VIPHGVRDAPVINNAKEKLALTGKKVLLLAGYIRSTKNFEKIIYLLPELIKRNKDLVLLMAARSRINEYSDYKEKLYKSIEPYISAGHVKVLYGKFPQETLDTILSAADLLALPYEKGAQSGVLAQASAMILPVITSDLLSFKNWIDEVKGGLYAKSDIDYISKITQILSDKDLRLELIQNIKNSNLKRNWNSIAENHIKLYKEQLKAPVKNAEFFYVKPKENKYVNC
jgi:glycosyltransferase involved in cell wall biosynthesis